MINFSSTSLSPIFKTFFNLYPVLHVRPITPKHQFFFCSSALYCLHICSSCGVQHSLDGWSLYFSQEYTLLMPVFFPTSPILNLNLFLNGLFSQFNASKRSQLNVQEPSDPPTWHSPPLVCPLVAASSALAYCPYRPLCCDFCSNRVAMATVVYITKFGFKLFFSPCRTCHFKCVPYEVSTCCANWLKCVTHRHTHALQLAEAAPDGLLEFGSENGLADGSCFAPS